MRPQPGTYPDYYQHYIPLVKEDEIIPALQNNWTSISAFISSIPQVKEEHAYAAGKWTVKQVVIHLCDTERILAYRALRFARKDPKQPLPFEEDHYAANAELGNRNLSSILNEYRTVREATLSLFKTFSPEVLLSRGNTAIGETTVLALGYMICGHAAHHANVINERYLKNLT
jgi:hypothetical protein